MTPSGSRWGVLSLLLWGALGAAGCGTSFNKSPVVREGPVASRKEVPSGTEVLMHLVVTDEEDGDNLRFHWLQSPAAPAGAFSDIAVKEPVWVAPEVTTPQEFILHVDIIDSEGATLQGLTSILVHPR